MSLLCVVPAAVEPVSLAEMCEHLREEPMDEQSPEGMDLLSKIAAARASVEGYCRRVLVMQTWELSEYHRHPVWRRLEDLQYVRRADHGIRLPYAPLLAVDAVEYVAEDGTTQAATYRVDRGSRTLPGTLWLTSREAVLEPFRSGSILVRWRAGYGGAIDGLTVAGTAVSGFAFTQGDVGLPIKIGSTATRIVSVDGEGVATVANTPTDAPGGTVSAYLGWSLPPQVLHAIKMLAADLYASREASDSATNAVQGDDDMPPALRRLLKSSRNLLS